MKRYYFIDKNIYFANEILPPRKVELFDVKIYNATNFFTGFDTDGNLYKLNIEELIVDEGE